MSRRSFRLVMSVDEMKRLLAVASSLKTRVLLSLGYGCGLRASEIVRLKVKHIDQGAEYHSHRAVEGSQGPQCDAVARDARLVAAMVEDAPLAVTMPDIPRAGTLAVSQQKVCWQADDDPPAQPLIP